MKRTDFLKAAKQVIENENYDLTAQEILTENEFATLVSFIMMHISLGDNNFSNSLKNVQIKVHNGKHSYISCSDFDGENGTGVARSIYYICDSKSNVDEDTAKTIADMVNEAWYSMIA